MKTSKVNFEYAFAEPHRLCVCRPDSSNKTLFDCEKSSLTMLWSDSSAKVNPLGAHKRVRIDWKVKISFKSGDIPLNGMQWSRIDGYIPALNYEVAADYVQAQLHCIATEEGDVISIYVKNTSDEVKTVTMDAVLLENATNKKWIDFDSEYSVVNPIFGDAGDRIIMFDAKKSNTIPSRREAVTFKWVLKPGESAYDKLVRPNGKYDHHLEQLMQTNWDHLCGKALKEWRAIAEGGARFTLPDPVIENAYKACLCDIFVMREEMGDGKIGGLAGTEMYRSANTGEPCFQAMALNKYGFDKQARQNIEFVAQFQLENGSWEDDKQWGRTMWCSSGWKSNSIKQYYLHTKDRDFLEQMYKRMRASALWSKNVRDEKDKKLSSDDINRGLMPRGMGDGGLNGPGGDLYGIFYPNNFMHCHGLEIAAWAAKELGYDKDYEMLNEIYQEHKQAILDSLERGHIEEEDYIWIGSSANCTNGSRWGLAEAAYPSRILPLDSKLMRGTLKKLQGNISEGGLPKNLGWIPDGIWVAIALDNLAYVNILDNNADKSAGYLVAGLNHGTPLFTWCEERTEEPDSSTITGDRQHAWTPISAAIYMREMLLSDSVFEDDTLHITVGVPRYFYEADNQIKMQNAPTIWGKVHAEITVEKDRVILDMDLSEFDLNAKLSWHIRNMQNRKAVRIAKSSGCTAQLTNDIVSIEANQKKISIVVDIESLN